MLKEHLSKVLAKMVLTRCCKSATLQSSMARFTLNYYMEGTRTGKLNYARVRMICRETRDKKV